MGETQVQALGWEVPLEKGMATQSTILAWKIPWTEEPGGLQSMGSQRGRQDLSTKPQQKWVEYGKLAFFFLSAREMSVLHLTWFNVIHVNQKQKGTSIEVLICIREQWSWKPSKKRGTVQSGELEELPEPKKWSNHSGYQWKKGMQVKDV